MPLCMSPTSDIDALIRDREAHFVRRQREEELAHQTELRRLHAIRARLVAETYREEAERLLWLSRQEIAALPPKRTPSAVRRAVQRARKTDPVEVRMRGREATYPRPWLEKMGICAPCAPRETHCAS